MKLLNFTIQNFRSIKGGSTTIDFSGSNILFLFGQNNAGKSSILSAYEYLVTSKKAAVLSDFYNYSEENPITLEAVFEKEEGDDEEFKKHGLEKWVSDSNQIRLKKVWIQKDKAGQKHTFNPETNDYEEGGFGGFDSIFQKHAPTPIIIPAMPSEKDLTDWINKIIKNSFLKKIKDLYKDEYLAAQEKVKELQEAIIAAEDVSGLSANANTHFTKVFPKLNIAIETEFGQELDVTKSLDKEFLVTIKDSDLPDVSQSLSRHGHGVIRQAMFNFLGIVEATNKTSGGDQKKEFLILFEEPEIYLHPKAIKLLRSTIYDIAGPDTPFQILCASHAPALIDLSKEHMSLVRIKKDEEGICNFYQVGENVFRKDENMKQWLQMINRFNPHVCETFFADNVVIVEGDTEAVILRELFDHKAPSLDIFVLNSGTKNYIPFFQEILTHFQIKHTVIHDSDTKHLYEGDTPKLNGDGSQKKNPAWSQNQKIWTLIEAANSKQEGLASRFVHIHNFEDAHDYTHSSTEGKPLSAYKLAQTYLQATDEIPKIVQFCNHIIGDSPIEKKYTQEELEAEVEK